MFYKLGSQLDYDQKTKEDQDLFEWNICLLGSTVFGEPISNVYIGTRTAYDPVVKLARNLVDELNKENQ